MDDRRQQLASALGPIVWALGGTGAIGEAVEALFEAGRPHQALELLRTLADPVELARLQHLAQSRLDSRHLDQPTGPPWALAPLLDDAPPGALVGDDHGGLRALEHVLAEARRTARTIRPGTVEILAAAAHEAERSDLLPALVRCEDTAGAAQTANGHPPGFHGQLADEGGSVAVWPISTDAISDPYSRPAIALAFDRGAAVPAQVAIWSAARAAPDAVFHLLTRGVSRGDLEQLAKRVQIPIVAYDLTGVDHGGAVPLEHIGSPSTLDRLLLPSLLTEVERVLYLDCDVLVQAPLDELATLDLGGSRLAARPIRHGEATIGRMLQRRCAALGQQQGDALARWAAGRRIPPDAQLFNAGVLILDLERLRVDDQVPHLQQVMSRFGLDDQDGLCLLAGGDFRHLDRRWNHLVAMDHIEDAVVVHWAGRYKPWLHLGVAQAATWWDHARAMAAADQIVWPLPGEATAFDPIPDAEVVPR